MATEKWSFQIAVPELREITNRLLDHLEDVAGANVDVPEDYYWNIPKEQIYNVLEKPSEFTIGQLTDDWQELRKTLDREDYEPICYSLVWLAAILRAIGEHVVK